MCGIAGYIDMVASRPGDRSIVERMSRELVHRGPDSDGYYVQDHVALSFRRLKIIDLFSGDQPLYSPDNSIVLMCNGEIYNYKELRTQLKNKNIRFKSKTDVEVLLYLYEEQGISFINRLNGQFAFVIYDRNNDVLYLARDQFGICPLFYTIADGYLIFASEIKSILQHPLVDRKVDLIGLDQIFSFPGLVSPRTLFHNIYSLESGQYIELKNHKLSFHTYWDLDFALHNDANKPDRYYHEQLDALLKNSVQRRMQSDAPWGCYLSGGLDSSLIYSYAKELNEGETPATFSVTFNTEQQDESRFQNLLTANHASRHYQIECDILANYPLFKDVTYHSECAVKETYNLCSYLLSRATRQQGYKVMLSGEGADELFGGYVGYRFAGFDTMDEDGDYLEQEIERGLRDKLWGDASFFYEKNLNDTIDLKKSLYSAKLNNSFDEFNCFNHPVIDTRKLESFDSLAKRTYVDLKLRLADHLLSDHGDRMAMANSVELRFPFLDIDLVQFAATVPYHLKIKDGVEKYVLRNIARQRLPDAIVSREKFGFHSPGTPSLLSKGIEWIDDLLSYDRIKKQGYFNPDSIENLKRMYRDPNFNLRIPFEDDVLMIVLSFALFLDVFSMPDT